MGVLSIYNLGQLGVNVDKNPLQLEDGELTTAQNIIPNPIGVGGIANRQGLVKLNSVAAADTSTGIIGGVGVPLPFTRRVYLAQFSGGGANWLTSTGAYASAATQATTPSEPVKSAKTASFRNAITSLNGATEGKNACNYGNTLIYASNNYTQGTTSPTVFSYDGSMDRQLFTVPVNPDAVVVSQAVMWVMANNGIIYFSTHDTGDNGGAGASTWKGSVYSYNVATNIITKLGATFSTGYLPYTLCWANDRLWVGAISTVVEGTAGKIYWIRPGVDTTWTLDHTFSVDEFPVTLLSFNGELYIGTYNTGIAGASATIQKRTTAGVYSTLDTAAGTVPVDQNWYGGLIQFGTSLYVGFSENGVLASKIRKFDGTTWSTVKSSSASVVYNDSFVDNSVLFFWGINGANTDAFVTSPDGTTWTNRIANITAGGNRPGSGMAVIVS